MAEVTVRSPNPTFTGVKAGVAFNNGQARVNRDNEGALAYFAGAGYTVGSDKPDTERDDLPSDTNARAEQTFQGTPEEDRGRHDVAIPPPSAGIKEWRVFARGYNLRDVEKATDKQVIIDRAAELGLI